MASAKSKKPDLGMKNTKQELLDAYNEVLEELEERNQAELKPEKKIEEKKKQEVIHAVRDVSMDGVAQNIKTLKADIDKNLSQLQERLESEVKKLGHIQAAISIRDAELREIYEIDRSASSLAALIETSNRKNRLFEEELELKKSSLLEDIEETRGKWDQEKALRAAEVKEQREQEARQRQREKEEYLYSLQRERQIEKDKFEDEKARLLSEKQALENEIKAMREAVEKELSERRKALAEKESEFLELKKRAGAFPEELQSAVAKASKDTAERLKLEADYQTNMLKQQYEGEKNVLLTRIDALEKTVKEQAEQISKLSRLQEAAYQKVQDVAVKAIEGASKHGSFSGLQQALSEQGRKTNSD
ncbi:MAG: hypothetical protein WDA72_07750 [Desulfomonilia bacterium]|jgi:hypothetical protein|nr:hypothetical protein [Deltaproteobacteria bacterium]MDX9762829.1 hypothetical protein [Desulfomonilia bacterium]